VRDPRGAARRGVVILDHVHELGGREKAEAVVSGARGSGLRSQGSGLRVQGSGFRAQGSGFRAQGLGLRV